MNILDEKEFEERSDNIPSSDLAIWNIENGHFLNIQKKLKAAGAKLIVGPRGTGKTHQMRIVYEESVANATQQSKPVAIFTSFGKYYYLEPLLVKSSNAIQIFHTWVLCKIMDGLFKYCADAKLMDVDRYFSVSNAMSHEEISDFISKAEKLSPSELISHPLISEISISKVTSSIEKLVEGLGKSRAVLLLDDAAITFTPDYLVEFFDIFRSLKTKIIAPKASVYPGTTQYGPRFHVGHDAEMVNCWLSVMDDTYIAFMNSLIEKRFSQYSTGIPKDVLDILQYASFGIPRAFISLLRNYKSFRETTMQANFNKTIAEQAKYIRSEYNSITFKMPQYKRVIEAGMFFFEKIVADLTEENKILSTEKNIHIGIDANSIQQLPLSERLIRFLIEAGLLYEDTSVRHGANNPGENREYRRYIPHILFLLEQRAFSKSRGFNTAEILKILKARNKKHPLRRNMSTILDAPNIAKLKLDVPPCPKCGTPRLAEEQKFCHICGTELIKQSAFESCMNINIDLLPIPEWQKRKIHSDLKINNIGELISKPDPGTELRKIKQIGPKRSESIHKEALILVEEFLA
jgi:hypothetical protein